MHEFRMILFMISLCWGRALHTVTENTENLDSNPREEPIAVTGNGPVQPGIGQ